MICLQWMLREGILLYGSFVVLFGSNSVHWRYSLPACYGIPAVIVAVSAGLKWSSDYGNTSNCWLHHSTAWAFIGPVLAIIAFNTLVFIRIMVAIFAMRRKINTVALKEERQRMQSVMRGLRASLSFLCLLGVTWVFGLYAFVAVV